MSAKPAQKQTVALTGAANLIGTALLGRLISEKDVSKILVIDTVRPKVKSAKVEFIRSDLTDPACVELLGKILLKKNCRTLIHNAVLRRPSTNSEAQHELHVTGTMHTLLAAEIAHIHKLILTSTFEVYGALPDNPSFITEDEPLRGGVHSSYLRDRIDIERQFERFQRRFPSRIVTIMRPCRVISLTKSDTDELFFDEPVVPTVLGFDPLMQFISIEDLTSAYMVAIKTNKRGAFNIASKGILPLSRALKIAGRESLPIASFLLYPAIGLLWHLQSGKLHSGHLDFLKFGIVIDTEKAKREFGFKPALTSQEALRIINEKRT